MNSRGVSVQRERIWHALVGGLVCSMALPASLAMAFDVSTSSVPQEEILSGGPPKDGIPAILDPAFVPAEQAAFLRDEDVVIGVVADGVPRLRSGRRPERSRMDGVAKAYPIRILNWHEVVNDDLGDAPIAVTWCPLTQSAVTFDRRVHGEVKTFGVSGRLYNSNVLMYDHQAESLWSQLQGAAVAGPQTETTLTVVPSALTSWRNWKARYPGTLVLSQATGHRRDYGRDPYARYLSDGSVMFPVSRRDPRLPAKAKVLGLVLDGTAKAYPLGRLRGLPQPVVDRLGSHTVQVSVDPDGRTAAATDQHGRLLPGTVVYWFAWAAFQPETLIYSPRPFSEGRGSPPESRVLP